MQLAPMGCAVFMHNKTGIQKSWSKHAVDGFYLGASREHKLCLQIWIKDTRNVHIADTVLFKNQHITVPDITKADTIVAAAQRLTNNLQNEEPNNTSEQVNQQLNQLVAIFKDAAQKTTKVQAAAQSNEVPQTKLEMPQQPRVQDITEQHPRVQAIAAKQTSVTQNSAYNNRGTKTQGGFLQQTQDHGSNKPTTSHKIMPRMHSQQFHARFEWKRHVASISLTQQSFNTNTSQCPLHCQKTWSQPQHN